MPRLQPIPLGIRENGRDKVANSDDEAFKFTIKWMIPEILIEVSDKVDETLLLPTLDRVIATIEIGDKGTSIARQNLVDDRRLSRFGHLRDAEKLAYPV